MSSRFLTIRRSSQCILVNSEFSIQRIHTATAIHIHCKVFALKQCVQIKQ